MTGPKTSAMVKGPSRFGAIFLYGYGSLRLVDSRRTLSPFLKFTGAAEEYRAIAIAACACDAIVFSLSCFSSVSRSSVVGCFMLVRTVPIASGWYPYRSSNGDFPVDEWVL